MILASVSCLVSPRKGDAPLSLDKPEKGISWKNKQQMNEITVTVEYTLRTFVALVLKQLCHVGKNRASFGSLQPWLGARLAIKVSSAALMHAQRKMHRFFSPEFLI